MLLEKGITGFFGYGDGNMPELDDTAFQRMCYTVRNKQWNMTGIFRPEHTNYFYAHFQGCYDTEQREKQEVLGVFTNNNSARYCYESVGFHSVGKTEIYKMPIGAWECLKMELEL